MKVQMDLLIELQEKDKILDQLRREIEQGPQRVGEIERQVERFEEDLEADKQRVEEIGKVQREYEAAVEDGNEHIKKAKGRLLTIKSNKEYQALVKEIETAEQVNREKEDKILGCMEEAERLKELVQAKGQDLSAKRERLEEEKKAIEARVGQAQQQLSGMEKHRADMEKAIDPELLAKYEQIKARSGGPAVALAENTTCSGCHMNIPAQMYNELQRRDSLRFCPNCERIIYWKGGATGQDEKVSE